MRTLSTMSIKQLRELKSKIILENGSSEYIQKIEDAIYKKRIMINEDDGAGGTTAGSAPSGSTGGGVYSGGVAYGDASNIAGMGGIASAQPSSLPGATTGNDFTNHGGTVGSGDIGTPLNNKPFQKADMGRNHGANTGKKSRVKKQDLKNLKSNLANKGKSSGKIMNFDDFYKTKMNKITKLKN